MKSFNSNRERQTVVEVSNGKLVAWVVGVVLQGLLLAALAGLEGSALSRMVGQ